MVFLSADRHESKANCASLLRDMLFNFGFGEVSLNQGVGDENLFLAAFKQRIGDTYFSDSLFEWNLNINKSRKSILYKEFQITFSPCVYLRHVKNIEHRIALTHFRTRNNRLFVETGSYGSQTVLYEERYCAHCNSWYWGWVPFPVNLYSVFRIQKQIHPKILQM